MRQAFNSLPLFSALDVDAIETIMSTAYEKRRWRDQAIFCEGEPVRQIFLLFFHNSALANAAWRQFRRDGDKFAFENSFFPSSRDESEPITGSGFSAAVPNHLGK